MTLTWTNVACIGDDTITMWISNPLPKHSIVTKASKDSNENENIVYFISPFIKCVLSWYRTNVVLQIRLCAVYIQVILKFVWILNYLPSRHLMWLKMVKYVWDLTEIKYIYIYKCVHFQSLLFTTVQTFKSDYWRKKEKITASKMVLLQMQLTKRRF